MLHKDAQEVWLHNERYLLLPDGAIVAPDWKGEIGFAHLFDNGEIWRYNVQIGRISDMEFGNMVSVDVTGDLLAGMLDTVMGDTE